MGHGLHHSDVVMSAMASQITGISIVYSTVCSGADQRKHLSCASLAFVRIIRRSPVNFMLKVPVTRKMFPGDDVIMITTLSLEYNGRRATAQKHFKCISCLKIFQFWKNRCNGRLFLKVQLAKRAEELRARRQASSYAISACKRVLQTLW